MYYMNGHGTRINERIKLIETIIETLGPVEKLLERIEELEKSIYKTKSVLNFDEACKYIGVSDSLLYKLTAAKEIPHYKPRGKMLYFNREEIDLWLLQNKQDVIGCITQIEIENTKK
ncbi:MAG: helix-turn-helix domain-containing protein [Bacteroides sp.]|nr:helix-turn-helix domain-containing protein [Bacteroides sp.]